MMMQEVSVEVEADPVMTTQEVVVGYEYDISYNVGLSDTDGSETLGEMTLSNLPEGAQLQNGDGEALSANEDGSYTLDTQADSTVSMTLVTTQEITPEQFDSVSASITSTDNDDASTATTTVTGDSESISLSGLSDMVENNDNQVDSPLSEEVPLEQVFQTEVASTLLFPEDSASSPSTSVATDTSTSTTSTESIDSYVDNSDVMSVEAPIEI
jgi:hypothetical protein